MPLSDKLSFHLAAYLKARENAEKLEADLKVANNDLINAEATLFSAMLDEEMTSFKTNEGILVTRMIRTFNSFAKFNAEKVFEWLRSMGGEHLIKTDPTFNTQTLGAFIKEKKMNDPAFEVPSIISSYDKKSISIRKP